MFAIELQIDLFRLVRGSGKRAIPVKQQACGNDEGGDGRLRGFGPGRSPLLRVPIGCAVLTAGTTTVAKPPELASQDVEPLHIRLTGIARAPDCGEDAVAAVCKFLLVHTSDYRGGGTDTM
jgi:hypothetical protein